MAGLGKKKQQRKARREEKGKNSSTFLPEQEFYGQAFQMIDEDPKISNAMSGLMRNMVRGSASAFTRRFDGVPYFLEDTRLWIFTRSLVCKDYNGLMDDGALQFADYDPVGGLTELPQDLPSKVRLAEVFLFFAGNFNVPGDLCCCEAVLDFLHELNSEDGINKLHGFYVVAAGAKAEREKVHELEGKHETA